MEGTKAEDRYNDVKRTVRDWLNKRANTDPLGQVQIDLDAAVVLEARVFRTIRHFQTTGNPAFLRPNLNDIPDSDTKSVHEPMEPTASHSLAQASLTLSIKANRRVVQAIINVTKMKASEDKQHFGNLIWSHPPPL